MGGIKRPPTEGLSLPHCIWLRLDHQFCFHGFSWVFHGFCTTRPAATDELTAIHPCWVWLKIIPPCLNKPVAECQMVSSKPPSYARSKPWRGATRSKKSPVTIAQKCDSCERNHKVLFVSVCVESSQMWVKHSLSHTHLQVEPSLRLPLHCWLAWKLTQERQHGAWWLCFAQNSKSLRSEVTYLVGLHNIASVCARVFHLSA